MSPKELDFEAIKQEAYRRIHAARECVLATSEEGVVTARMVMVIPRGDLIGFFTTANTRKYRQILANPRVAVVMGDLQIEGTARLLGHPAEPANADFMQSLESCFTGAPSDLAEVYVGGCQNPALPFVFGEITPTRFQFHRMPPNGGIEFANLVNGTAFSYCGPDSFMDYA